MSGHLIWAVFQRDVLLAYRRRADVLMTLAFFVLTCVLFPLGVGPEPSVLHQLAPGVLWVAALLSTLLSLGRLFAQDNMDGTLDQMVLAVMPLFWVVLSKVAAHWVLAGLPLVLLSPLMGVQFGLDGREIGVLMGTLALGTPLLSLIGAVGAALTAAARGGSVLLALLVLPLYVPVLIFGAGAVGAQSSPHGAQAHLQLLGGLLLVALVLAPLASAAALRIALE